MKGIRGIGRIVFALAFIGLGVVQLYEGANFAGLVPWFMPVPTVWVYVVGIAYIAAAISILTEIQTTVACILLGLLVFLIAFSVHLFNIIHASNGLPIDQFVSFFEALAVGAGAFYIAAWYGIPKRRVVTEYREGADEFEDTGPEDPEK
jgi:uncharacterized membrane protein YphA (DoxX/SURF4 family)